MLCISTCPEVILQSCLCWGLTRIKLLMGGSWFGKADAGYGITGLHLHRRAQGKPPGTEAPQQESQKMRNSSSNLKSKAKMLKENVTEKSYIGSDINTATSVISFTGSRLDFVILKAL